MRKAILLQSDNSSAIDIAIFILARLRFHFILVLVGLRVDLAYADWHEFDL